MFDFDHTAHAFVDGVGKVLFRRLAEGVRYYYAEDGLYVVAYGNTET